MTPSTQWIGGRHPCQPAVIFQANQQKQVATGLARLTRTRMLSAVALYPGSTTRQLATILQVEVRSVSASLTVLLKKGAVTYERKKGCSVSATGAAITARAWVTA